MRLVLWIDSRSPHCLALTLFLLHAILALFYKLVVGIDIQADPTLTWDWLWQTLSVEALRNNLWHSLWNLHSQPPLFNLYGALLAMISASKQLQLMQYCNTLLGSFIVAMVFYVVFRGTGSKRIGSAVGVLLALHPGLFLAEAFVLYEVMTAFFVVSSVFILSVLPRERSRDFFLSAFTLSVACLVLTRSLYHLLLLYLACAFAWALIGHRRWAFGLLFIIICTMPTAWYAKNYVKFGFFGSSSWYGMNLWNMVSSRYSDEELETLVRARVLDPVVVDAMTEYKRAFLRPFAFREYGFCRESDESVLSLDDYNNINIPAISRVYFLNSVRLIRHDPNHYVRNMLLGYAKFSSPPGRDPHHRRNVRKPLMHVHEFLYFRILQGQWIANRIGKRVGLVSLGSISFVLMPLGIGVYLFLLFVAHRFSGRKWLQYLRRDPAMLFGFLLIVYTTMIGCMFEMNENQRFRFPIEPIFWAFFTILCYRVWKRGRRALVLGDDIN